MEGEEGRSQIFCLVDRATNSTGLEVDPRLLKSIKSTVRSSDTDVRLAVDALMMKMSKDHSQVRYLTLLIIDELFMRSKIFRSLLVANFDQFLSLSIGFRRNLPLPPPHSIASLLCKKTVELLEKWTDSFGIYYRQLRLGYDYSKNILKIQFPNRLENAARVQQEKREREIRTKQILLKKFEGLKEEFPSVQNEIQLTLQEIRECFIAIGIEQERSNQVCLSDHKRIGRRSSSCLQQIRFHALEESKKVHEDADNNAVFDTLRELSRLLETSHFPFVQQGISILLRVEPSDTRARDSLLKELIDAKSSILAVLKICKEQGHVASISSDQKAEEDIWEEGKVEVSNHQDIIQGSEYVQDSLERNTPLEEARGKEAKHIVVGVGDQGTTSPRRRLLSEAPTLDWGPYLYHWGSSQDVMVNHRGLEIENHWGRVDQDAIIPAEKIAQLSLHTSLYKEQQGQIRPCLAPLPKGGLCQRKDLKVCPFHGLIVPRDLSGNRISGECSQTVVEKSSGSLPSISGDNVVDFKEVAMKLAKQAVRNIRREEKYGDEAKKGNKKAIKRRRIMMAREHNESVLRESALASTSRSESIVEGEEAPIGCKRWTLSSMLHKKTSRRERLVQRLLAGNVADATLRELGHGEESKYQENCVNQW